MYKSIIRPKVLIARRKVFAQNVDFNFILSSSERIFNFRVLRLYYVSFMQLFSAVKLKPEQVIVVWIISSSLNTTYTKATCLRYLFQVVQTQTTTAY